ncbi:unnamed protein product, partial [Rotaria magnacalcarata]
LKIVSFHLDLTNSHILAIEMSNKFMEAFIPEEVLIVWYQDALIDYYDDIFKLTFDQELADCVKFFYDNIDDCVDFMTNIKDEKSS